MRLRQIVTGLVFLAASAGAALGQTSGKAAAALRAADQAWEKIYAAKDLDKSVAFCDEQGSMLVANAPIATGKDALAKAIASDFAHDDLTWYPEKAGVARSGELGYTSGIYKMNFKDSSGKTLSDQGKYFTVWKKQGGR
jgi:ketosteroid isomerase-like protein